MKKLPALITFISAPLWAQDNGVEIGSRLELFVDGALIEKLAGGAELRLHHPIARDVAISHDARWEGTSSGYHTVFRDGDVYRMYYRGLHIELENGRLKQNRHEPFYCYAESRDGISWTRPDLGIVEFEGSKKNNIILKGIGTHNFSPMKDGNPACSPEARYKALGGLQQEGGLFAFQSADGVNWSLLQKEPVITEGAFDSQNLAFWDPTIGKYRAYWRVFTEGVTNREVWKPRGVRAIRTATSGDFITWENQADLTYEDSPKEQLYTNQVHPYIRAPHLLMGLPTRYVERGWSEPMRALPDLADRENRANANQRYGTALTETVFMASRDGIRFKRWNEAFIRPGAERPGTWQYGQNYTACHAVETKSQLPGAGNELSFYVSEAGWHGEGNLLRRHTLRLDGFVSVHAPLSGGEVTTSPVRFSGNRLTMNFSTSAAGSIRVEIQDAAGEPLDGFRLEDCPEIFGDTTSRVVSWKNGPGIEKLAGKPIRLRFEVKDADLFSYRFTDG